MIFSCLLSSSCIEEEENGWSLPCHTLIDVPFIDALDWFLPFYTDMRAVAPPHFHPPAHLFFLFSFTAHLVVSSICASVSGATPPGYDFYYRWEMSWAEPTDDTKKHRSSDELLLVLRICLKNVRAFQFASVFFYFLVLYFLALSIVVG